MDMFLPANLMGSCIANNDGAGLFLPAKASKLGTLWLLNSRSGKQTAVSIAGDTDEFTFSDLSLVTYPIIGTLIPSFEIEVDPLSAFHPPSDVSNLGNLIFNAGRALIVSYRIAGDPVFDLEKIDFADAPAEFTTGIGYTNWRLVVRHCGETQVIWTRYGEVR